LSRDQKNRRSSGNTARGWHRARRSSTRRGRKIRWATPRYQGPCRRNSTQNNQTTRSGAALARSKCSPLTRFALESHPFSDLKGSDNAAFDVLGSFSTEICDAQELGMSRKSARKAQGKKPLAATYLRKLLILNDASRKVWDLWNNRDCTFPFLPRGLPQPETEV
jgi:hypothetical protein